MINKKLIKNITIIIIFALILAITCNYFRKDSLKWNWEPAISKAEKIQDINILKNKMENPNVILVDVRNPKIYEVGHIPTAINWPLDEVDEKLEQWLSSLPINYELIIYCNDELCDMADIFSQKLSEKQIDHLIFEPGFDGWEALQIITNNQ